MIQKEKEYEKLKIWQLTILGLIAIHNVNAMRRPNACAQDDGNAVNVLSDVREEQECSPLGTSSVSSHSENMSISDSDVSEYDMPLDRPPTLTEIADFYDRSDYTHSESENASSGIPCLSGEHVSAETASDDGSDMLDQDEK